MTGTRQRSRRTHTLGGCKTCRRRHVKCDQKRPTCQMCRTMGMTCEGFSDEIRWMPSKKIQPAQRAVETRWRGADKRGTRRHLYTEKSRLSMSDALGADLVSGSIDASLTEIDARSRDPQRSTEGHIVVGPFSVLDFSTAPHEKIELPSGPVERASEAPPVEAPTNEENLVASAPLLREDPLADMNDLLQWSDLFGLGCELPGTLFHSPFDATEAFSLDWETRNPDPEDRIFNEPLDTGPESRVTEPESHKEQHNAIWTMIPLQTPVDLNGLSVDVLSDAPFLLRHFQDHVIPRIMAIPLNEKPPWKILNVPSAVVTYGDMTFMGAQNISHARRANLYSILACSAMHLSLNPTFGIVGSADHWKHLTDRTYHLAKDHMQLSLRDETHEPKRAKYKDQLMAICALTEFAILSGQQQDARCYMVDAERLLRLRGMPKRRISQKARLLHHLYTWLRIVGESTYALHDYTSSDSFVDAINHHFRPLKSDTSTNDNISERERNSRLDDFLRLHPRPSDSDLNIDDPKDDEVGLFDIHLQDSRQFSGTLYRQVYGIPETWLSLVAQTTRLANVMDTLKITQNATNNKQGALEALEVLQRRCSRLENMICSFNHSKPKGSMPDNSDRPHAHLLRAVNSALVIFFYRRIRQVHPVILEGHVDNVISALKVFDVGLTEGSHTGPGTIWPLFIAGCEATTSARRESVLDLLKKREEKCRFATFKIARDIMLEVWEKQDENTITHRGDAVPTWLDVVKQRRVWPVLC